jgi:transposase-like protein
MTLALMGNTLLRTAITRNLVSFPAQIRPFMRRSSGDLQERIVQLYFVRGWSVRDICARYSLSKAMAHKLLGEWRVRAVESGYIQEIEPGTLASLSEQTASEQTLSRQTLSEQTVFIDAPALVGEMPQIGYGSAAHLPMQPMEHPAALSAGSGV